MRDEDRVLAAIADLTNQVARVAYATETSLRRQVGKTHFEDCSKCLCTIVPIGASVCPACYEPTKDKTDG